MYILATTISMLMIFGFIFGVMIMLFTFLIYAFGIAFMLWMLVDAARQDKFLWVVIIVALPVIGALVYFFVEKEREYAKIPKEKTPRKKAGQDSKDEKKDAEQESGIKLAEGETK
jgi:uncharacterized membrane protein YeiB